MRMSVGVIAFLFACFTATNSSSAVQFSNDAKIRKQLESLQKMPLSGDAVYFRRGMPAYIFPSDAPVGLTMTSFPRLMLQGKGIIDEILLRIPESRTSYPFEFSLGCG